MSESVKNATPNTNTAIAAYTGPLSRPAEGTPEGTRFRTDAEQMIAVARQAELDPTSLVLWDGVPRFAGDLVKAWRKATYTAESKRLHRK